MVFSIDHDECGELQPGADAPPAVLASRGYARHDAHEAYPFRGWHVEQGPESSVTAELSGLERSTSQGAQLRDVGDLPNNSDSPARYGPKTSSPFAQQMAAHHVVSKILDADSFRADHSPGDLEGAFRKQGHPVASVEMRLVACARDTVSKAVGQRD